MGAYYPVFEWIAVYQRPFDYHRRTSKMIAVALVQFAKNLTDSGTTLTYDRCLRFLQNSSDLFHKLVSIDTFMMAGKSVLLPAVRYR